MFNRKANASLIDKVLYASDRRLSRTSCQLPLLRGTQVDRVRLSLAAQDHNNLYDAKVSLFFSQGLRFFKGVVVIAGHGKVLKGLPVTVRFELYKIGQDFFNNKI